MTVPVIDNLRARRIFLARHGLAEPPTGSGSGAPLADVIARLGFVQLDSVNTFARAHDHILWARRMQYRPAARDRLHVAGGLFEHWTHDAAAIPMAFYPYWRLRFARDAVRLRARWPAWQGEDFIAKVDDVLRHVADHGCCMSSDVGDGEARGSGGWWDWHPSKTALEYLWRTGALAVVRRDGFRKVYDLTERVIPAAVRAVQPTAGETIDWLCRAAITRLGFGTSGEIAAFWNTVTPQEAKDWCVAASAEGTLAAIDVEGADGRRRRVFAPPGLAESAMPAVAPRIRILSPFDPALRDRKRAEWLFGFHYRIEIFVPADKRRYGYYVFPVLEGDRLIGRVDMKRDDDVLVVTAFWPEPGVRMGKARLAQLDRAFENARRFAGCDRVEMTPGWLRAAG